MWDRNGGPAAGAAGAFEARLKPGDRLVIVGWGVILSAQKQQGFATKRGAIRIDGAKEPIEASARTVKPLAAMEAYNVYNRLRPDEEKTVLQPVARGGPVGKNGLNHTEEISAMSVVVGESQCT